MFILLFKYLNMKTKKITSLILIASFVYVFGLSSVSAKNSSLCINETQISRGFDKHQNKKLKERMKKIVKYFADKLEMSLEELYGDYQQTGLSPYDYLKEKGFTDKEIIEPFTFVENSRIKERIEELAGLIGMDSDLLKEELILARLQGKNIVELLEEKGLAKEQILDILPIPKHMKEMRNKLIKNISNKLGITQDIIKEELLKAKLEDKNIFEYLKNKGLSDEEIKEIIPKKRFSKLKKGFEKVSETLGLTSNELKKELIEAKKMGVSLREYLENKGISNIDQLLYPKKRSGSLV